MALETITEDIICVLLNNLLENRLLRHLNV